MTALLIVDLLLFNGFTQGSPDPSGATDDSATANALAAFVAAQGPGPAGEQHRVALFDPDRYYSVAAERLGQPDLTILRGLSSVQGYGAVVDANYDRATDTHTQLNMKPAALADGTFAQLDLGVLATVPEYFVHLVVAAPGSPHQHRHRAHAAPAGGPDPRAPPDTTTPPPTPHGDYQYVAGPGADGVAGVGPGPDPVLRHRPGGHVGLGPRARRGPAPLRVGLLSPDGGHTTWIGSAAPARPGTGGGRRAPRPPPASGIVLEAEPGPGRARRPAPWRSARRWCAPRARAPTAWTDRCAMR